MSIATILTRLQKCHAEVTGIVRATELPPTKTILPGDLPFVHTRPGPLVASAPATSPGAYVLARRYIVTALVTRSDLAALDTSQEGAEALALCAPILDAFADYYVAHPRLHTDGLNEAALGELAGVWDDVTFTDSGPSAGLLGPDGQRYAGLEITLTIAEYRKIAAPRLT